MRRANPNKPNNKVEEKVDEYFVVTKMHPGIDKKKQLVGVIENLLTSSYEQGVRDAIQEIYDGVKHYSIGHDDFAGAWIDIYKKKKLQTPKNN